MNEMQVFRNEQFGQVRGIDFNGEPWTVGKDVAISLGYKNPLKAIRDHVDDEDKMVNDSFTVNGTAIIFINESGIHSLILSSKLAGAKRFKRWVTKEVLPSIRKTGSYITGQGIMDALAKNPRDLANLLNQYADAMEQKAALEAKIEADKPKVEFAERLSVSDGTVTIKQFAALLCQKGYRTGEIRMFEELRQDGFLLTNGSYKNEPAQKYLEMRIFEVRTYDYTKGMTNYFGRQPVITAKGIEYLLDYYMRKHDLMPLLSIHRKPLIPRPTLKQLKAGHSHS